MKRWRLGAVAPLVWRAVWASAATLHEDQGHPLADDGGAGAAERSFRAISAAAAAVRPGDTVQIAAGVYREHVSAAIGGSGPQAMIAYQARPGDRVVLKGSDPWKPPWTTAALDGMIVAVWRTPLGPALFQYDFPIENYNPFHQSPLRLCAREVKDDDAPVRPVETGKPLAITRGAIFLESQPLRQIIEPAHFQLAGGQFMLSAAGQEILLRALLDRDPNELAFEIGTRKQAFTPRRRYLDVIVCRV